VAQLSTLGHIRASHENYKHQATLGIYDYACRVSGDGRDLCHLLPQRFDVLCVFDCRSNSCDSFSGGRYFDQFASIVAGSDSWFHCAENTEIIFQKAMSRFMWPNTALEPTAAAPSFGSL